MHPSRLGFLASCCAAALMGCGPSDGKDSGSIDGDSGFSDGGWDTDSPPVQARLSGDLSLRINLQGVGEDTCVGSITVDVDTDASPPFSGTADCEFEGSFATLGALSGDLQGDFIGDGGAVEGTSSVSAPGQAATELPWSGTFDGQTLRSDVKDTVTGDRFDIDYRIVFTAE